MPTNQPTPTAPAYSVADVAGAIRLLADECPRGWKHVDPDNQRHYAQQVAATCADLLPANPADREWVRVSRVAALTTVAHPGRFLRQLANMLEAVDSGRKIQRRRKVWSTDRGDLLAFGCDVGSQRLIGGDRWQLAVARVAPVAHPWRDVERPATILPADDPAVVFAR